MKKNAIKRYMPVTVFTALMATITSEIAYTFGWWKYTDKIVPWGYITNPSFVYGLFSVLTIWIFYLTAHKFWLYFTVNVLLNAFQWFFLVNWTFVAWGIVKEGNLNPIQMFLVGTLQSLIIYGYHRWQETIFQKKAAPDSDGGIYIKLLSFRAKAK